MAKGSPSMIALLGLLAVAGFQNREKLGELLNNRPSSDPNGDPRNPSPQGSILNGLRNMASGSAGAGNGLAGLSELFDRFTAPHQRAKVDSWVQHGPNAPLSAAELEEALDEDTLAELTTKTGLSRSELLIRLSTALPEAVDQATPDGVFPPISAAEPRLI